MRLPLIASTLCVALAATPAGAQNTGSRHLSRSALEDKIRGGWAGQMIGVSYGAPTEFRSNGKIIEGNLNKYLDWSPERLKNAIDQDDLYVEMTFAEVMDKVGLDATTEQYGEMFKDSKYELWHANAGARRNLNHGIKAPMSGHPKYNIHANDIDFQIESDFIGLMTPGLPREANKYADRVGRVMNWGDGLYGGMFFSGMYAAAFFENDPRKVVEQGLRSIPAESAYAKVIADVLRWSAENPDDWTKTWHLIEDKWDKDDVCPDGALDPFNIDAKLNGGYVALGLLYGKGDFAKTLEVATRSGQDSDCNPSSAAGILGVMLGYDQHPRGLEGRDTRYRRHPLRIHAVLLQSDRGQHPGSRPESRGRSRGQGHRHGNRDTGAGASSASVWSSGTSMRRESAWSSPSPPGCSKAGSKTGKSSSPGAESSNSRKHEPPAPRRRFTFDGTGVAIVGRCTQEGGRADVFLDGKKVGEIDAWIPKNTTR